MSIDDCISAVSTLPDTGLSTPVAALLGAVSLLVVGLALIASRRTRAVALAATLAVSGVFAATATATPASANADLTCTASLSGLTWFDANADGIRQDRESPAAGQTITLLHVDGDVLATTTTDQDGEYSFTDLPAWKYQVSFPTQADGQPLTTEGIGTATTGSDAHTNGRTDVIKLADGENKTHIDAGYVPDTATATTATSSTPSSTATTPTTSPPTTTTPPQTSRIGDTLWFDENGDGIQDPGEPGLDGITVTLRKWSGGKPTVHGTQVTVDGHYSFDNLEAGSYIVIVPIESPDGLYELADIPSNPAYVVTTVGQTDTLVLAEGEVMTDIDVPYWEIPPT